MLEETVGPAVRALLDIAGTTEGSVAIREDGPADGMLSVGTDGLAGGDPALDGVLKLEGMELAMVGPAGGEISLDDTIGPADVKLE